MSSPWWGERLFGLPAAPQERRRPGRRTPPVTRIGIPQQVYSERIAGICARVTLGVRTLCLYSGSRGRPSHLRFHRSKACTRSGWPRCCCRRKSTAAWAAHRVVRTTSFTFPSTMTVKDGSNGGSVILVLPRAPAFLREQPMRWLAAGCQSLWWRCFYPAPPFSGALVALPSAQLMENAGLSGAGQFLAPPARE
jgi:hypothetical protein